MANVCRIALAAGVVAALPAIHAGGERRPAAVGVKWYLLLDDYCLCNSDFAGGHAISIQSRSCPFEMWPRLLEKAIAKLSGGYYNLEAGLGEAHDGPSWPSGVAGQEDFPRYIQLLAGSSATPSSVNLSEPLESVQEALASLHERGFVMKASSKSGKDFGHDHFKLENGIVPGHAYAGPLWAGTVEGHYLVYLRNTWGAKEWTGTWSDTSDAWRASPKVKTALLATGCFAERKGQKAPMLKQGLNNEYMEEDDGGFLIELKDFCKHFARVDALAGPAASFFGKRDA